MPRKLVASFFPDTVHSCTTDAVFSEVTISERAENSVRSWRAVSLR